MSKNRIFRTLTSLLGQMGLLAGALLISAPSLYMLSASFMNSNEIFQHACSCCRKH